jgi:hypothetical protein
MNKAPKEPLKITQQIKFPTPKEIKNTTQEDLNPRKAPGYDLITGRILKGMPGNGIVHLTTVCNEIIRTGYFPVQWKVPKIIMILKPGESLKELSWYRPISLPPGMTKIFEKAMLKRSCRILGGNQILPDRQFGFRQIHSTIEQVHRFTKRNFKKKQQQHCSAAFLDSHKLLILYGTQVSCSKSEKYFPMHTTEH